jgi:hypothetical protein
MDRMNQSACAVAVSLADGFGSANTEVHLGLCVYETEKGSWPQI